MQGNVIQGQISILSILFGMRFELEDNKFQDSKN